MFFSRYRRQPISAPWRKGFISAASGAAREREQRERGGRYRLLGHPRAFLLGSRAQLPNLFLLAALGRSSSDSAGTRAQLLCRARGPALRASPGRRLPCWLLEPGPGSQAGERGGSGRGLRSTRDFPPPRSTGLSAPNQLRSSGRLGPQQGPESWGARFSSPRALISNSGQIRRGAPFPRVFSPTEPPKEPHTGLTLPGGPQPGPDLQVLSPETGWRTCSTHALHLHFPRPLLTNVVFPQGPQEQSTGICRREKTSYRVRVQ